jgi:hypothetical protein
MKTELTSFKDDQKFDVSYPDGKGAHQIDFADLKNRFNQESDHWFDNFVYNLRVHGYCYTNMGAKYVKI